MILMRRFFIPLLAVCLVGFSLRCGIYTFTGVSLSSEIRSLSVQNFYNNAPLGPGNLGIVFTEQLKGYFLRNTSLSFVPEGGDLHFAGSVEDYSLAPVAVGNRESSGGTPLTRFSISVLVTYTNTKDGAFDLERKKFSFFKDIDQNKVDFSANESVLIEEVFEQIILDIFNQTVASW